MKFAREHLKDSEGLGESFLVKGDQNGALCHQHNQLHGGGNIMNGVVFLLQVQDDFTALRDQRDKIFDKLCTGFWFLVKTSSSYVDQRLVPIRWNVGQVYGKGVNKV